MSHLLLAKIFGCCQALLYSCLEIVRITNAYICLHLLTKISFAQVGTALAVDLTAEEELCSDSALQVAVNSRGKLCSASQRGSSGVNPGILQVGF